MTWEEYAAEYGCKHPTWEKRKKASQRQGKTLYKLVSQCVHCGYAVPLTATSRDLSQLPLYDHSLVQTYNTQYYGLYRTLQAAEHHQRHQEWWNWYTTYLTSPQWDGKRTKVLERAQGLCEGCRNQRPTQVHHITYAHVGNELLFELVAICESCHAIAHSKEEERVALKISSGKVLTSAW